MMARIASGKQRGVALITAILMVALATILAVKVGFDAYLDFRRASTVYAIDQSFEIALGAEAWAADFLSTDLNANKTQTHLAQTWAKPLPPIPIDGGEVSGQLEDMQGRFNLNNLLPPSDDNAANAPNTPRSPNFPNASNAPPAQTAAQQHQAYLEQFKRILELAQLESAWAERIVDWIDEDNVETFPDGAEDNLYNTQTPSYLAANMPITRVSELLALKDFGLERFRKLEPFVSALPPGTKINLCTAPGIVLDSFAYASKTQTYSLAPKVLEQQRGSGCWPDLAELSKFINSDEQRHAQASAGTMSEHFLGTIVVTIGTNQFTLYSHLARNGSGQVRSQLRSFGSN